MSEIVAQKWTRAGENLYRNAASGNYFVRIKRGGRQVWRSLGTDKLAIARDRRAITVSQIETGLLSDAPQSNEVFRFADNAELTLGRCASDYLRAKMDEGLKPSSMKYVIRSVKMVHEAHKGFADVLAKDFTEGTARALADLLRAKYSASRFNGSVWALRGILEEAVKAKVITDNPAKVVAPQEIQWRKIELPTEERIAALMGSMRRNRHRFTAFLFLTLMLESSQRPGSIRLLRPEHVNLKLGTVDWVPFKHAKTTDALPMTRKMRAVLRLLLHAHRRVGDADAPLVPIKFPRKALIAACKDVGISPALTPHKFRHICSTRMAEANIPYGVAAEWRRDSDGGATFMKVYVHPRRESLRQVVNSLNLRNREE